MQCLTANFVGGDGDVSERKAIISLKQTDSACYFKKECWVIYTRLFDLIFLNLKILFSWLLLAQKYFFLSFLFYFEQISRALAISKQRVKTLLCFERVGRFHGIIIFCWFAFFFFFSFCADVNWAKGKDGR